MSMQTRAAGDIIYRAEDKLTSIDILMKGTVNVTYQNGEFLLEKGDVLGIMDIAYDSHNFTYTALSDVAFLTYPYVGSDSLYPLLQANKDLSVLLSTSMTKQICQIIDHFLFIQFESDNLYHFIMDSYDDYKTFCATCSLPVKTLPEFEELSLIDPESVLPSWVNSYYDNIRELSVEDFRLFFQKNIGFATGYLLKASIDIQTALLLCEEYADYNKTVSHLLLNEDHLDFFDLYTDLYCKTAYNSNLTTSFMPIISKLMIYLEGLPSIDITIYQQRVAAYQDELKRIEALISEKETEQVAHETVAGEVAHSLSTILEYAQCSEEFSTAFQTNVDKYRSILAAPSSDEELATIQKALTVSFYELYTATFKMSLQKNPMPIIVKMFLSFGYVDETLAGIENSLYLYSVTKTLKANPPKGIFTIYEWLLAIYAGKKEPSRNEFDNDYVAHLHELKVAGKIDAETEASLLSNRWERVTFELQNMFPLVSKMAFGRISNYCPILSEHNILKNLPDTLLSATSILTALEKIRSLDYSAYFRESVYTNKECDLAKEYVQTEILPDIILLPCIGTRGIMWQEIEGKRRSTPARMMLPILAMTDITTTIIRLTGEFRWEMCKRIQGSRWNDVSERSLTSDYFDYIQFYRKNFELSADAKEKVKLSLIRARNSFKECFVQDYIDYITYEGNGSPRLNKVARNILFTYCPFSKNTCEKLQSNPLYSDTLNRHRIKQGQLLHRYELLLQKLKATGHAIPDEIAAQEAYIKG